MTSIPQMLPVTCPHCRAKFAAPIQRVVDVGQDPKLKVALLQGRLNVAACPQCGNAGMLNAPFIYHDLEKELALCFVPTELGLTATDQQKLIGDLTNAVLNSLPPERRKGYLLQPRIYLSLQGLIDTILQADGVTKEMIEAQRARGALVYELLDARNDEHLKQLVEEHDAELDYEFFQTLTAAMETARADGKDDLAQRLSALRTRLLDLTTVGKREAAQRKAIESLGEKVTQEDLLQKMIECEDEDQLQAYVALGRPLMDYTFFLALTEKINAAQAEGDSEEAQRLTDLRARILEFQAKYDAQVAVALQWAANLLKEILQSQDREAVVRAHLGEIDDTFFAVLSANIAQAEEKGEKKIADDLRQVGDLVMELLQESAPPEIRLINQLMQAEYPEGTKKVLEENVAQVTADLIKVMDFMVENLKGGGHSEAAQRLSDIRAQAETMVGRK
ncbi:MAG: hypothetical protein E3J21_00550 [Anaerolineales bacterium]|nr:MAG: hypothetical protein E3J21_00550 [Anaerolineales bacterium]